MKTFSRVAIVYDRVNKFGGAERVLLSLRRLFPESVLFTSVYDAKGARWVGDWEVRTSFLQRLPLAKRHHEWFAPLMPLAFESLDFTGFDLIISVTSEFAKNLTVAPDQLHVCYCLTPTRYLWSHTNSYGAGPLSLVKQLFFSSLRKVDFLAAQRPAEFLAISRRVQKRIRLYYRRKSGVIFPALTLPPGKIPVRKKGNYCLAVSRLVPYKRVDLAIEACISLKRHLHIVGTGSDGLRLLEVAGGSPYIHFEGQVSDEKLKRLYAGARALICPQEEDFGLVSLEAQANGVPVVSYSKSGVAETILDGRTGILFTEQTTKSLSSALKRLETKKWNASVIRKHALTFGESRFHRQFKHELNIFWKKNNA